MTRRRPIDQTRGLAQTRRSMGDGTVKGRSRIATPHDPRRLRRPGSVVAPRRGQSPALITLSASMVEVEPGGTDVEFDTILEPPGRAKFVNAEAPLTEVETDLIGVFAVTVTLDWHDWRGGGDVEIVRNGVVVYGPIFDPTWRATSGVQFVGTCHLLLASSDRIVARVTSGSDEVQVAAAVTMQLSLEERGGSASAISVAFGRMAVADDGWTMHVRDHATPAPWVEGDGMGSGRPNARGGWVAHGPGGWSAWHSGSGIDANATLSFSREIGSPTADLHTEVAQSFFDTSGGAGGSLGGVNMIRHFPSMRRWYACGGNNRQFGQNPDRRVISWCADHLDPSDPDNWTHALGQRGSSSSTGSAPWMMWVAPSPTGTSYAVSSVELWATPQGVDDWQPIAPLPNELREQQQHNRVGLLWVGSTLVYIEGNDGDDGPGNVYTWDGGWTLEWAAPGEIVHFEHAAGVLVLAVRDAGLYVSTNGTDFTAADLPGGIDLDVPLWRLGWDTSGWLASVGTVLLFTQSDGALSGWEVEMEHDEPFWLLS